MIGVALCGFVVRLLIIAHSHGGNDLANYSYFSRIALHGGNPFDPPAGGLFSPSYANSPPLEFATFAAALAIHDSPTTLRLLLAIADVVVLLLVGLCFPRPRRWRAAVMVFYAFDPFVLLAWIVFAEDKALLFLGITWLLLALERGRQWSAWAAAAALTAFKFLGAFAAPALAIHSFRRRRLWGLVPAGAYIVVFLVSNVPWLPKSLDAFSRRNARLAIDPPIHASPTLLLARLGIYAPIEAKLLSATGIVAVLGFFLARRIDVREAVVWSLFAGYAFLPDDAFDRLLLITLPFFLILDLSVVRWVAVWVVSSVAALAGAVATRGVPRLLSPIAGLLRTIFSHEATTRHVLWMNLLPLLVLAFYFSDRRAGRLGISAPEEDRPIAVASARSNPSTIAS